MKARHALPNPALTTTLSLVRRRWWLRLFARAVAIGGAAFALALVLSLSAFDASRSVALWVAVGAGAGAAVLFAIANRRWSALDAAKAIELAAGSSITLLSPRRSSTPTRGRLRRRSARRSIGRRRSGLARSRSRGWCRLRSRRRSRWLSSRAAPYLRASVERSSPPAWQRND